MKNLIVLTIVFFTCVITADEIQPYMGIFVEVPAQQTLEALDSKYGVMLTAIVEDSPAEKAGLKVNMLLLKIDGEKISTPDDIMKSLKGKKPGDKLSLQLKEKGKIITSTLVLTKKEPAEQNSTNVFSVFFNSALGVETQTLTPQLMEYFEVSNGLLVRTVTEGSPSEKNGIKAGDIIVKADDKKITSNNQLYSITMENKHKTSDKGMDLIVIRKGKQLRKHLVPDHNKFSETYSIDINPTGNSIFVYSPEFTQPVISESASAKSQKSDIDDLKKELEQLKKQFEELQTKHK